MLISNPYSCTVIGCGGEINQSECLHGVCRVCRVGVCRAHRVHRIGVCRVHRVEVHRCVGLGCVGCVGLGWWGKNQGFMLISNLCLPTKLKLTLSNSQPSRLLHTLGAENPPKIPWV